MVRKGIGRALYDACLPDPAREARADTGGHPRGRVRPAADSFAFPKSALLRSHIGLLPSHRRPDGAQHVVQRQRAHRLPARGSPELFFEDPNGRARHGPPHHPKKGASMNTAYETLNTPEKRRAYYLDNGYIVRPGLIPASVCDEALARFRDEIKPYPGFIYRQASANPEKHKLDSAGNMLNSILNPIAVNGKNFPRFRN